MSTRRTGKRTETRIEVSADRGVFMISVAAELAEMHPQTLRIYEARGLIEPKRSPKGTRLYSREDVERLRRIQALTNDAGLNLAGVERVLALEAELERAQRKVAALDRRAAQLHEEIRRLELVRERVRAEIVHVPRGNQVMVRAADARSPFRRPAGSDDGPADIVR